MSIAILRSITFIKASDKLCAPIYREKALLTVEQGIQIVLGAVHHAQYLVWRAINDVTGQKRQRERAAMLCCECCRSGPVRKLDVGLPSANVHGFIRMRLS